LRLYRVQQVLPDFTLQWAFCLVHSLIDVVVYIHATNFGFFAFSTTLAYLTSWTLFTIV
jgi:hypothetical protein